MTPVPPSPAGVAAGGTASGPDEAAAAAPGPDEAVAVRPRRPATVRCVDLVKRFPDGTTAVDGVTLRCEPGALVVLVGPSGCGKTTLLRTIAGLEAPTAGTVWIDDEDVTHRPAQRRGVAMVFQNYALYPDKTVAGNIEFPLRMSRVPAAERRRRVVAAARLLRIEGLLERRPAELSGGQKQRVGIGRAIVRAPRVLLMDEPLSNLDAQLRTDMRAEVRHLQATLGTTIVYVTHDQVEALTLADQLVVLRDGRVEQAGPPDEAYRRPRTRFVAGFLGGMNLLDATLEDGHVRVGGAGALPAPATSLPPGSAVVAGVRPDDLALHEVGEVGEVGDSAGRGNGSPGLDGEVAFVESTGTTHIVHVTTGDQRLKVTLPTDRPVPQGRVRVEAPASSVHVFPPD